MILKKCSLFLVILLFLFFAIPSIVSGLDTEAKKIPHKIPEISTKIEIDGVLNEQEWAGALELDLNYETAPGENIASPVKTKAYLAYSGKYIYVGIQAYDPNPSKIRAHYSDRDNIWDDDFVGIVLDTFNDSRLAHNFYCNPFGVQADQILTMTGASAWDGIWDSAGRLNKEGYCVEMAIPFTSLRFQGKKGDQVWGIDVVRGYPRDVDYTLGLIPLDRSNNCYMCQADKIVGFSGAKPGRNLEFDPTLSGILTQVRDDFPDGKFVKEKGKVEPGITARWSITPNLTLMAAANPDFSQVEADNAQLDINTQFALYYAEKRPFFLEGSNIFQSRFFPVYTRTVVDPDWGIKLTGKAGKNSIGFFSARDSITNLIIPSSENSWLISLYQKDNPESRLKNTSSALRYRREIGRASNIGFFLTDREGTDYYNRLAGIDADMRFTRTERFAFQYLASQTRYPDDVVNAFDQPTGKFSGGAFDALYSHTTRTVFIYGHYQQVTPNFRGDVGFVDQTGTKLYDVGGSYTWRKRGGSWYTRLLLAGWFVRINDSMNDSLLKSYRAWVNYNGPLQSFGNLTLNLGKKTYQAREFNDNNLTYTVQVRTSGSFVVGITGVVGNQVDFTNVREGNRVRINPYFEYRMGRHVYLSLDHVFEKLRVDGGRLYTANLSNLRLVYQFNRRAFLRAIIQYVDYNYNSALYLRPKNPEFRNLFSQILFSYKLNPQTVLFLGYSDDYYGYSQIPLTQNNRTFFMKIGYALVM